MDWDNGVVRPVALDRLGQRYRRYRLADPHAEDAMLIEAVRSANKAIDIDNVNRVLMQPHWHKDADLVDY